MVRRLFACMLVCLLGAALALVAPVEALAAPANDDITAATAITALPFTDSVDTSSATVAPDDPPDCFSNASVWYAVTPDKLEAIEADTFGSDYDTTLSVFTRTNGNLVQVACNNDAAGSFQSRVVISAAAGTTYFLKVAVCCGFGGVGGHLAFHADAIPAPGNDDFAAATQVSALPFDQAVDTNGATIEPGEPRPVCGGNAPTTSVWYAYTPATSGVVTAAVPSASFSTVLQAYTGSSISTLANAGCTSFSTPMTISVTAGTTYHFQLTELFGERGAATFHLAPPPPPHAAFQFFPTTPSVFDNLDLFDTSVDPANLNFDSFTWDFGDGSPTATGFEVAHRYAADGDYTVLHTATTRDGRTASISAVVSVRTHDVSIAAFTVPKSGKVGKTSRITVRISDTRYAETVQVDLLVNSDPSSGAFRPVGSLTQTIPVKAAGKTTPFDFDYTFTPDDGQVGKVTFETRATIIGARDAFLADNTVIATFTTVAPGRAAGTATDL